MSAALEALPVFVRVAERESFTAAAQDMGVSKSHVSKTVRALEDRLGVRLFNRTTRRVTLTHAGLEYFERCRRVLAELDEAEQAVALHQSTPVGLMRITIPVSLGKNYLAVALSEFLSAYPDLELDVEMSDRRADLFEESFDVAIRVGELADSSLVARKLAHTDRYLVASPAYIKKNGEPKSPAELERHVCLRYGYQADGSAWKLYRGEDKATVRVSGPVLANNGELLCEMAAGGHGISSLPDFIAHDYIRDGRLVPVLREWSGWRAAVWAVFPHRRHLSNRVRVFVDFLAERLQPEPPWSLRGTKELGG